MGARALRPDRAIPAVALLVAGCAAQPEAGQDEEPFLPSFLVDTDDPVSRLTGTDNGLQLFKWLIDDDATRFADAMSRYADGDLLPPERERALRRNGFRIARVPVDDLPALQAALGASALDVHGWHGQLTEWRPIFQVALERRSVTIAVDGRIRTYDGGSFVLDCRTWTMPMEDGPVLHLELVPAYRRPARGRDYRHLLADGPVHAADRIESSAMDLDLQAGSAYVLTCERPGVEWRLDAEDGGSARGLGPDVDAPLTVGQLMLSSTETTAPRRGVLVFVPRIPKGMFPGE